MRTEAEVKVEVKQVILALGLIGKADFPIASFGDRYKQVGLNFSLEACKVASRITGVDECFCKMLNHKFRTDAAEVAFEMALRDMSGSA